MCFQCSFRFVHTFFQLDSNQTFPFLSFMPLFFPTFTTTQATYFLCVYTLSCAFFPSNLFSVKYTKQYRKEDKVQTVAVVGRRTWLFSGKNRMRTWWQIVVRLILQPPPHSLVMVTAVRVANDETPFLKTFFVYLSPFIAILQEKLLSFNAFSSNVLHPHYVLT